MSLSTNEVHIKLTYEEYKDLKNYCDLNKVPQEQVVKNSYKQGFNIERYGLLSGTQQPQEPVIEYVEKEVIKYVEKPVEVIKEIEVIREIIKEIPSPPKEVIIKEYVDREVVREVPVEKIIEKIVKVSDDTQINELLSKIEKLENTPPKIVEVIKEITVDVIKEVIVEKEVQSNLQPKLDALQGTLQKVRQENIEKEKKIQEYEKILLEFKKLKDETKAVYLRGSNLDDKLYK